MKLFGEGLKIWVYAMKDIKKGDELSYDYGFSFDENFKQFPCYCRSKNCVGYIVREGSRWRIKKKKKIKNKMKKILFITTRNPYSGRYSGDVIRSLKIINLIKKKISRCFSFSLKKKRKKLKMKKI